MKVQLDSVCMFITVTVPFKVGEVSGTALRQILYQEGENEKFDISNEFLDLQDDLTYMGNPIENYSKLREFHTSIGINLNKLIDIATDEPAQEWAIENTPERIF